MCIILMIPAGSMVPTDKLFNGIHNNPHGYGLLAKKDNVVEEFRGLWMEPEDMHKLLLEKIDTDRYLHVRYNTAGATNLDNVHPFKVYDKDGRKVWFMHNGTLHRFRPNTVVVDGVSITSSDSDSKKFAETFLAPLLERWHGKNGIADTEDEMFKQIVEQNWDTSSKGLILCNDLNGVFLSEKSWITHEYEVEKDGKKTKFEWFSSNDTYFEKLIRGPLYEQRKAEVEAARKEEQENVRRFQEATAGSRPTIVDIKTLDLKYCAANELVDAFGRVFDSVDIWEHENLAKLAYLTSAELEVLQDKHPVEFAAVTGYVFQEFGKLINKVEELEDQLEDTLDDLEKAQNKHTAASKRIAELHQQVTRQKEHVG